MHAEVNLSNFDEQRQQRSHHGDVVAGSGRRSQEGGGGLPRWDHTHTHKHTHNPSSVRGLVTPCLPRRSWAQPGWLQAFCVSLSVCVCHTKGVHAWAAICHPPSQGEERGGGDPWPLKPPVGPFSQSHAGRAPCLKSHGCLSGIGMEGGGWGGEGVILQTLIDPS